MALTVKLPETITQKRLIEIVREKRPTQDAIPRLRAILFLRASEHSEKLATLASLINDENEKPRVRIVAAMGLYEMNTVQSRKALLDVSQKVSEETTLAAIAQSLGMIGDQKTLQAIHAMQSRAKGFAKKQAAFAASLISYRLNLPGAEVSFPQANQLLPLTGNEEIQQTTVALAKADEAALCLRGLEREPFGIAFASKPMYQIICQPNKLMLLLNEDFAGEDAAQKLHGRKSLLGLLARKSENSESYSASLLIFASPRKGQAGKLDLLLHRPTGDQLYAGTLDLEGGQMAFSVQAVDRPGISAIAFAGEFASGRLKITDARSSTRARKRRLPTTG
jgi:hypothetical protein